MSERDRRQPPIRQGDDQSTRVAGRSFNSDDFATKEQLAAQLAATLGEDAMPKALRIANDVAQAAYGIFREPPKPRATSLLRELRSLLAATSKGNATPDKIPPYLWPYIGVEDGTNAASLCSSPLDLERALEVAINVAETDSETCLSRRGGRHRDPRIDHFVTVLGIIYRRHTNKRPTVTFSPDTGELVSPFGLFVLEAFTQFYPSSPIPEGSIQGALKSRISGR